MFSTPRCVSIVCLQDRALFRSDLRGLVWKKYARQVVLNFTRISSRNTIFNTDHRWIRISSLFYVEVCTETIEFHKSPLRTIIPLNLYTTKPGSCLVYVHKIIQIHEPEREFVPPRVYTHSPILCYQSQRYRCIIKIERHIFITATCYIKCKSVYMEILKWYFAANCAFRIAQVNPPPSPQDLYQIFIPRRNEKTEWSIKTGL